MTKQQTLKNTAIDQVITKKLSKSDFLSPSGGKMSMLLFFSPRTLLLAVTNVLVLFFLWCGISCAFDTSVLVAPIEVEQAAQKGLQRYLKAIPEKNLHQFNFQSQDEFNSANLGMPFRVFIADPSDILRDDTEKSLLDLVRPTPIWFFPVISRGEICTILTVDLIENEWKAISIGNTHLVKPFASVLSKWPVSNGYNYVFVRNYQTMAEFVILLHSGESNVVPLPSAIQSLHIEEGKMLKLPDALKLLRDRLKQIDLQ